MTTAPAETTTNAPEPCRVDHRTIKSGQKCYECDDVIWSPFGGATSFAQYDRYKVGEEKQRDIDEVMYVYEGLRSNILQSDAMGPVAKADALVELSESLRSRLEMSGAKSADGAALAPPDGSFTAFKDQQGQYRWVTIHANKYEDREREIFSDEAHREYADWATESKSYPALRLYHIPVDIGQADQIAYDDRGFMVATGTFAPGMEDVAERLKAWDEPLACSHGYRYRREDFRDGVYHRYRDFEISILPASDAANPLTAVTLEVPVEGSKMITPKSRKFFESVMGPEGVKTLERTIGTLDALAQREGLSSKAMSEAAAAVGSVEETPMDQQETQTAAEQPTEQPATTTEAPAPATTEAPAETPAEQPAGEAPAEGGEAPAEDGGEKATDPIAILAAGQKQLTDVVAMLAQGQKAQGDEQAAMRATLDQIQEGLKAIQQGTDEQVANLIRPRAGAPAGQPASEAATNVASPAVVEALTTAVGIKSAPHSPYTQQAIGMLGMGSN